MIRLAKRQRYGRSAGDVLSKRGTFRIVRFLSSSGEKEERSEREHEETEASHSDMLEKAVKRMATVKKEGKEYRSNQMLEHKYWQLRERQRRRPGWIGMGLSLVGGSMARWSGILDDGKFAQGATMCLERLHEAMSKEEDEESLEMFCDRPLARELRDALLERQASHLDICHGVQVLKPPVISSWRICLGLERREATWFIDEETQALTPRDDWHALDLLSRAGLVLVLPHREFQPIKLALTEQEEKPFALYSAITKALNHSLDNRSLSLQAVVDFPQVREALVAYDKNDSHLFWSGSTDGFVYTSRQLILETPAFRFGEAVDEPLWTLVDVDNLMNGGARFWRHNYVP